MIRASYYRNLFNKRNAIRECMISKANCAIFDGKETFDITSKDFLIDLSFDEFFKFIKIEANYRELDIFYKDEKNFNVTLRLKGFWKQKLSDRNKLEEFVRNAAEKIINEDMDDPTFFIYEDMGFDLEFTTEILRHWGFVVSDNGNNVISVKF